MTQAKNTPGPWMQHPNYPWIIKECNAPISDEGVTVASTTAHESSGFFPSIEQGRANARLIAAAPELLEALIDAVCALECCGKDYQAAEKARAAITKATGVE